MSIFNARWNAMVLGTSICKTTPCVMLAILATAWCGITSAQTMPQGEAAIGRLFTTPAERAEIDALRQKYGVTEPSSITQPAPADTKLQSLKVSGVVLRADGKKQIWINGKLQPQHNALNTLPAGTTVTSPSDSIKVNVSNNAHRTTLKPGQTLDARNGKAVESYLVPRQHSQNNSIKNKADTPQKDTENEQQN